MILEEEARLLLKLKQELEDKEKEYEDQRLIVHNKLVNRTPSQIEIDGFRISKIDDYTQMRFDKDLLLQELKNKGLTDSQISVIIAGSKAEKIVFGLIKIVEL